MGMENVKWDVPTCATEPPHEPPHEHLKIIRCGCKIECYTHCTCTTYGLKCTSIGTGCRRVSCQNYVLSNLNVEV